MLAFNDDKVTERYFFIDGPGGSGKKFLYTCILHAVRGMGDHPIPVACNGIAASMMKGGSTVHSRFNFAEKQQPL